MSAADDAKRSPVRFAPGDFLPGFTADSNVNKTYVFDTVAGHRLLMAFIGSGSSAIGANFCETLLSIAPLLKKHDVRGFVVTSDPADRTTPLFAKRCVQFIVFWDSDKKVHERFGMTARGMVAGCDTPVPMLRVGAFVVRENLRLETYLPTTPLETFADRLAAAFEPFGPRGAFESAGMQAPVLMVPEVFSPDLCQRLIGIYKAHGGTESGFMREIGGMTRGLLDKSMKRRKDVTIVDETTLDEIRHQLRQRLLPEIRKAYNFTANRIERYIVACYDAEYQGFFRAHRDNTSRATAHRRFAVTINLNAGEYDGGELWFPEYGRRLYRPPTGGAVVFSCALLHEARPVTRGTRYAFLPFLYDAAAAAIREQNRRFLSDLPMTPVEELDRPAPIDPPAEDAPQPLSSITNPNPSAEPITFGVLTPAITIAAKHGPSEMSGRSPA